VSILPPRSMLAATDRLELLYCAASQTFSMNRGMTQFE